MTPGRIWYSKVAEEYLPSYPALSSYLALTDGELKLIELECRAQ